MDEKTRAHFYEQMVITQQEFDKLRELFLKDVEKIVEEDIEITHGDGFTMKDSKPVESPIKEGVGWPHDCDNCGKKHFLSFKPNTEYPAYCRPCYDAKRRRDRK